MHPPTLSFLKPSSRRWPEGPSIAWASSAPPAPTSAAIRLRCLSATTTRHCRRMPTMPRTPATIQHLHRRGRRRIQRLCVRRRGGGMFECFRKVKPDGREDKLPACLSNCLHACECSFSNHTPPRRCCRGVAQVGCLACGVRPGRHSSGLGLVH